ncbi:MAG: SH3 domain-containing protein [Clostridia bacterium]|nr:SH3 domain-containing protein [Clostridia bacterium]
MKKVIIIAMLLTILCVCGLSAGVCFADETSEPTNEWYYFEKSTDRPNLPLRETANEEGKVLLYIPHSYAFEKIADPDGAFVKVKYNSKEGYISTAYFNSNCTKVSSKWGNNAYTYDLSDLTVTAEKITPYKKDDMSPYTTLDKKDFTINKVYGYYIYGNDYYFLIDAIGIVFDNPNPIHGYIKASDTNRANFNEKDIPVNAGYTLQTTPDKPTTPSGSMSSGNTNTPSADKNGSDTQTPKNSLDRYILIAVIAVLCVVIVILIFVPTRKRQ